MRTHGSVVADVLLVEGDPEDVALFRRALGDLPGRLHVVAGGPEAIDSLRAQLPALVLVNSRTPGVVDALLKAIADVRQARRLPLPIHVFGPPVSEPTLRDMYRLCSAYTVIPEQRDRYAQVVRFALDYWLNRTLLPPPPHGTGTPDLPESSPGE